MSNGNPYSIGSDHLPGLSKLVEELGEVSQVAGKIIGLGHMGDHWDGSNLKDRLEDEVADLIAAIGFFGQANKLDHERGSSPRRKEVDAIQRVARRGHPHP